MVWNSSGVPLASAETVLAGRGALSMIATVFGNRKASYSAICDHPLMILLVLLAGKNSIEGVAAHAEPRTLALSKMAMGRSALEGGASLAWPLGTLAITLSARGPIGPWNLMGGDRACVRDHRSRDHSNQIGFHAAGSTFLVLHEAA